MRTWSAALAAALVSAVPVAAEEQPLVCFGNEPSWSVVLDGAGAARPHGASGVVAVDDGVADRGRG